MHDGKRTHHGFRGIEQEQQDANSSEVPPQWYHPIAVQRPMPDREVGGLVSALTRQMMAADAR